MKHLISKVKSLFKHKEKQVFIWLLDKDFFKNANIQFNAALARNPTGL